MKRIRALLESLIMTGIMFLVYEIMYYLYMYLIRFFMEKKVSWIVMDPYLIYGLDERSLHYMKDHPVEYTLICWIILLLIFLLVIVISKQSVVNMFKLRYLSIRNGFASFLTALGLIMTVGAVMAIVGLRLGEEIIYVTEDMQAVYPMLYLMITVGLIAPIFEELFFRGLIMGRLAEGFSATVSVILASGFFAISHLNILQSLLVLPVALLAGLLVSQTRSIWSAIWLHVVYNSVNIYLAYHPFFEYNIKQLVVLAIVGLVVVYLGISQLVTPSRT